VFFDEIFSVVTKPSEGKWPFDYNSALGKTSNFKATTLHKVDSERALLSLLLALLYKADPDLLVGHDIASFDLPTLLTRLSILKVENWSRLGRLRRANKMENFGVSRAVQILKPLFTRLFIFQNKSYQAKTAVSGRLVCDIKLSAQELIKSRSYDLDTLCETILKIPENQRVVFSIEDIRSSYE
jgi:DNA polymerase alpha subunit A